MPNWFDLTSKERYELYRKRQPGQKYEDVMNSYSSVEVPAYEDGGIGKKVKDTLKGWYYNLEKLTPEAMGVYRAKEDENFNEAYKNARLQGSKNFYWGNDKYTTDYSGEHHKQYEADKKSGKVLSWEKANPDLVYPELVKAKQEELDTYGITNEQTQDKKLIAQRLHANLYPFGYHDPFTRILESVVANKKELSRERVDQTIESSFDLQNDDTDAKMEATLYKERMDAFSNILGYPMKYGTLKISDYKPSKGASSDYYYAISASESRDPFENARSRRIWRDLHSLKESKDHVVYEEFLKNKFEKESKTDPQKSGMVKKQTEKIEYLNSRIKDLERDFGNFVGYPEGEGDVNNFKWSENDVTMGWYTGHVTPKYMSYYDLWDINPFGSGNDKALYQLGKSFNLYDRKYMKDTPSFWKAAMKSKTH